MPERQHTIRLLHVYGQDAPHGEVIILGNRDGLTMLRDTINRALVGDEKPHTVVNSISHQPFTADGEGFLLVVHRDDTDWQGERWQRVRLPYTDPDEQRPNAVSPRAAWRAIRAWAGGRDAAD